MTPYYDKDGITIYCGDCLEVMPGLDGPEVFIFDPPYNIGFKYDIYHDNLTDDEYIKMMSVFKKYDNVVIIQYPEEMQRLINPAMGPPIHTSAWCYNSNGNRRFRLVNWYGLAPNYERIKQPYKNPDDKRIKQAIANGKNGTAIYEWWTDIQQVKNVSEEKTDHPCPVPVALIKRIIVLGTMHNEIVTDPFMGSGTTLVAAQREGRRAVGIEISEDYCKIAVERLRQPSFFSIPNQTNGTAKAIQPELFND